jgi:hypothetical protein
LDGRLGYHPNFYPLLELGIAQVDWKVEYMHPDEVTRCADHVDRVLPGDAFHHPPGYPRDAGTLVVRMRGAVFPPIVNAYALAAFTPSQGDPRLVPYIAEWLWTRRQPLESDGTLSASAWCLRCGEHFLDARAGRGHVVQVARWCPGCRGRRVRHLPTIRRCAADDCFVWFQPARANQLYHAAACKEAARVAPS